MYQKSGLLSYEHVAQALLINGDTKLLLLQIKQNDQAAMVQLVMLHMNNINFTIKNEINCGREKYHITTAELKSVAIQVFMDAVKEYVNAPEFKDSPIFNDDEESEFRNMYEDKIRTSLIPILEYTPEENRFFGKSHLLPRNVAMLNKLNRLLTEKQEVIKGRVNEYLELIKQRIKNKDIFTKDYHLELDVSYFVKDNWDPIHTYWTSFRYEREEELGIFDTEITDWIDECMLFMPVLDAPCCWLMHDLIDHSHIGKKLWQIENISFNIKLGDRTFVSRREFLK